MNTIDSKDAAAEAEVPPPQPLSVEQLFPIRDGCDKLEPDFDGVLHTQAFPREVSGRISNVPAMPSIRSR